MLEIHDSTGENDSQVHEIDLAAGDFAEVVVPSSASGGEVVVVGSKVKDVVRSGPCRLLATDRIFDETSGATRSGDNYGTGVLVIFDDGSGL